MGFEEFKIIETCIFRLEERLLSNLKNESKAKRREMLKKEIEKQDTIDLESSEYWKLLEEFLKEENLTLRKISKSVVSYYGVS